MSLPKTELPYSNVIKNCNKLRKMNNKIKHIKQLGSFTLMSMMALSLLFSSCKEEEDYSGPITIGDVYLQDQESSVPNREVTFVRLGQTIRIEGSGFTNLRKIEINGFDTYFNPVLATDINVILKVDNDTPIIDADSSVRNTIHFYNDGNEAEITFDIRDAAPSVTSISNTLPTAGETITVYGSGLTEITSVVFPGDVEVTSGIESDVDGEYFTVTVPDGISEEGGSLLIEGANGGAYSPAYFNFKKGVIMDFDGNGTQGSWDNGNAGMITADDLESATIGAGNTSQGYYVPHRPDTLEQFEAASNRCSEVWTAGNDVDDWRTQLTDYIPTTTPVSDIAFQFDVYVPEEWDESGFLKICLINAFNGGEWAGYSYNYVPWIVDGEVVPFQTEGWITVTVPFSEFYEFSDDPDSFTFEDVLVARESSSYKNFGFYFENSDFTLDQVTGNDSDEETTLTSVATDIQVYTDNWRVVSLDTPTYSDFSDDEDTTE